MVDDQDRCEWVNVTVVAVDVAKKNTPSEAFYLNK